MSNRVESIQNVIDNLNDTEAPGENLRAKALTITKLEEALMWMAKIMIPSELGSREAPETVTV